MRNCACMSRSGAIERRINFTCKDFHGFFFFCCICFKNVKTEATKKPKAPTKVEKLVTVVDPPQNVVSVKPEPVQVS